MEVVETVKTDIYI